jgi:hypothetical protein
MSCSIGRRNSSALVKSERMSSGTLRIEDWNALLVVEDMRLPDGLVEGISLDDWQRLLDCLAEAPWVATFSNEGIPVTAFVATEMFDGDFATKTISIELVCGAVVNVYLRSPISLDFDFHLDEIECQQDLDEFLGFVRLLGQQTNRDVRLLYEGSDLSFGGYVYESDDFYLFGSEPQSQVRSSMKRGYSEGGERSYWERSRLVVAATRLREFRNLKIGLKQLVNDLLPLLNDQTLLPQFWNDAAMDAWGLLEVDYALAADGVSSIPDFASPPVRQNILELENLIEEGKQRFSLLDSPLHRFAFNQPLMTWREAAELYPSGSTVEGSVTLIKPFGCFIDLNVPFAGLVNQPDKDRVADIRVGDRLKLTVVDLSRERIILAFPK